MIGYQEHATSWAMAGHCVIRYRNGEQLLELVNNRKVDNAVVINPNNPTGELHSSQLIEKLSSKLSGILLIDEAFSDLAKNPIQPSDTLGDHIVVMKSIGKFFGLAGARIGFVIGKHNLVTSLNRLLAPWSLAAPSMKLATMALNDRRWQAMHTLRINAHAKCQRATLNIIKDALPNSQQVDQGLFFSTFAADDDLAKLHLSLAKQKIWSRLGDAYLDQSNRTYNWLRFSLAGDNLGLLSQALAIALKK